MKVLSITGPCIFLTKRFAYPASLPEQNPGCALAGDCNTTAIRSTKGYLKSKDYVVAEGLQEKLKLCVIFFARLFTKLKTILVDAEVDDIKLLRNFFIFTLPQSVVYASCMTYLTGKQLLRADC